MSTTSRFVGPSSSLVRALANTVVSAASETAKVLEIFEKNAIAFDVPENHRREAAKILTDLYAERTPETAVTGLSVCLDIGFTGEENETLSAKMRKILCDLKPGFFVGKLAHNETDYLIVSTGTIKETTTLPGKPYQWNARREGGSKTLASDPFTHREHVFKTNEGDDPQEALIYLYAIPFPKEDTNYYMWLTKEGKDIKRVRFKTSDGQIQMI